MRFKCASKRIIILLSVYLKILEHNESWSLITLRADDKSTFGNSFPSSELLAVCAKLSLVTVACTNFSINAISRNEISNC